MNTACTCCQHHFIKTITLLIIWPFSLWFLTNILPWTKCLLLVLQIFLYERFSVTFPSVYSPMVYLPAASLLCVLAVTWNNISLLLSPLHQTFFMTDFPLLRIFSGLSFYLFIVFVYGEPVKGSWWSWLWPLVWPSKMTLPISLTCRKQRRHNHQPIRSPLLRRGTRSTMRVPVVCVREWWCTNESTWRIWYRGKTADDIRIWGE